jgi:hypothetical protein
VGEIFNFCSTWKIGLRVGEVEKLRDEAMAEEVSTRPTTPLRKGRKKRGYTK